MRVLRFSMLTPLSVAAAAPREVVCRIIDENVEWCDFDTPTDLVGVSFMTFNAPRAYEIAREFKRRGKTVLFGGYHPSLMPQEAVQHADALCIGPAEPSLPRMIGDWRQGRLQRCYESDRASLPSRSPDPGLLRTRHYVTSAVVQATRGCPHACTFCSVAAFSRHTFATRPVDEVVEEIRQLPGRVFLFMDDNLTADRSYATALFRAIVPLRKRWFAQAGCQVAQDPSFLRLMRASGCRGLFMGFESLGADNLARVGKSINRVEAYREAVARLHQQGIAVMGAFVLGFDQDTAACFDRLGRFLREVNMDALQLTILTPLPGTPVFERLSREGRIFDRNWEHYNLGHVVFRPAQMSVEELVWGHAELLRSFYSWPAMIRRMTRQVGYLGGLSLLLSFSVGVAYRYKLRRTGVFTRAREGRARSLIRLWLGANRGACPS